MIRQAIQAIGHAFLLFIVGLVSFAFLISGFDEPGERSSEKHRAENPVSANSVDSSASIPPDLIETVMTVNRCFEDRWQQNGIEVAPDADWLTVCRRISLSLVGTGMSLQEIRELQPLPESQRVAAYLEKLLNDARYHDYWAERFTRTYVGADEGPFIAFRRRRFHSWLSDSFAANRPYDEIVRRLVTATGLPTDQPEVNFFTVTLNSNENGQPDPIRMAARTSRAFLGLRIDCMQCHDDFLGNVSLGDTDNLRDGTQRDFHSLAAFYSGARLNGLQGVRNTKRPYEYQFLHSDEQEHVEPAVPYAAELLPAEGSSRDRLATWLTHPENTQAARAAVNRVWALVFGRSLTDAVDNIPLNADIHPAMDLLATDFVEHHFNMRRLIRLVVHSRPFHLDSAADFEVTERHEAQWSVFPLVRLRPEQVAGSVVQAARIKTVDRDSSLIIQLMKLGGVNDFVERYGDIGEDEFDQDSITITQRLIMLNGKLVDEYSEANPVLNSSSHLLMFAEDNQAVVDAAYLSVLNRTPDDEEREAFATRLAKTKKRENAIEDLFWVLLNSSEFAWNH